MHTIDWILVLVPILLIVVVALFTKQYVRSVADFLAGGRLAGRYLLANARGESDAGLTNSMSKFEIIMISGFVVTFWEKVTVPMLLLVSISGFIIYRYRETRALTLAQFFEMRYSRGFRLYMGGLAFLSGILNYGVFPAISARFFIYFLQLPLSVNLPGFSISTMSLIMISYLTITVAILLVGGQVTMMITDCLEGLFSHAVYILIAIAIFTLISWDEMVATLTAPPPEHSMLNPFDAGEVQDFNLWYVLLAFLLRVYTTMALQNKQGFNAAAKSPHESRMAAILGEWRGYARMLMLLVLGISAVTFMNNPDFAEQAAPAKAEIASIDSKYLQKQMTVPVAMSYLLGQLPPGIKGLFLAIMIMGLVAGDAGHLHSWGSIFVQDVLLPLRSTAMSTAAHIWSLRLSISGVAVFAFLFSTYFPLTQYIALWMSITGSVFTAGAAAAIIGGLYWKKGNTAAAWTGAILGSVLNLVGIALGNKYSYAWLTAQDMALVNTPAFRAFPLNYIETAFLFTCVAAVAYIVVALLTNRGDFNLDQLLHRGRYSDEKKVETKVASRKRSVLGSLLKFDDKFTFRDKLAAGGVFWWSMFLVAVNVIVTIWNTSFSKWSDETWKHFWLIFGIAAPLVIALGTFVWFTIGGIIDMRDFYRGLRNLDRDTTDDGRVSERATARETPVETAAGRARSGN